MGLGLDNILPLVCGRALPGVNEIFLFFSILPLVDFLFLFPNIHNSSHACTLKTVFNFRLGIKKMGLAIGIRMSSSAESQQFLEVHD